MCGGSAPGPDPAVEAARAAQQAEADRAKAEADAKAKEEADQKARGMRGFSSLFSGPAGGRGFLSGSKSGSTVG